MHVCIDSAYLQACLTCFLFFTEEERQLQANNRDFNLQFEYAVSYWHMLFHADVVTDAATSASCLVCCFKGVTWLDASYDAANKAGLCQMNLQKWFIAESAIGSSAFGVSPANGQLKEIWCWKSECSDFSHFQKIICESKLLQDQASRPFNNGTLRGVLCGKRVFI